MESLSSRCLCQNRGCSQIQPCEAGSVFQKPPAAGAFTGFLRFMLYLDTVLVPKEEQKHLRSAGGAPQPCLIHGYTLNFAWEKQRASSGFAPNTKALKLPQQSPAGEMDTQPEHKTISRFWFLDVPSGGHSNFSFVPYS